VALIEPENLLIKIVVRVERLHAYIGSMQATLQKTPKVLLAIRVDLAIHIRTENPLLKQTEK